MKKEIIKNRMDKFFNLKMLMKVLYPKMIIMEKLAINNLKLFFY